ncbi:hypothetical protein HZS55_02015 [Halosimplex rubrum]|uniref:Uncharacterized protein n=1 Tax=Halosimplex rubrum TaxID=869889 RepID=A0A7D5SNK8_9EURY|nr:hypothetical protein [Halosimplex rubrum]QLH75767.1 hypothetical protein HZS55_02015 [Halosimplex rubrum]
MAKSSSTETARGEGTFDVKAAVNTGRFRSGKWREVARASGVGAGADD